MTPERLHRTMVVVVAPLSAVCFLSPPQPNRTACAALTRKRAAHGSLQVDIEGEGRGRTMRRASWSTLAALLALLLLAATSCARVNRPSVEDGRYPAAGGPP